MTSHHQAGNITSLARQGRLRARPRTIVEAAPTGRQSLTGDGERIGILYVPPSYRPARPAPLAFMLHGAGGNARQGISLLAHLAEETGLILAAVDSVGSTWDVILGEFGQDVARIDRALDQVFAGYAVDPERLAIGGFSDGASFALSVGLTNGDLFTHIVAFSPGFAAPAERYGMPGVYISHGTHDRVLPIDRTSRRIVPALRRDGYHVEYLEFDGPHTVPPAVTLAAVGWFIPMRAAGSATCTRSSVDP
ncbi:MAG: alpha/beta hydrolase [Chloroflexota bacterium]